MYLKETIHVEDDIRDIYIDIVEDSDGFSFYFPFKEYLALITVEKNEMPWYTEDESEDVDLFDIISEKFDKDELRNYAISGDAVDFDSDKVVSITGGPQDFQYTFKNGVTIDVWLTGDNWFPKEMRKYENFMIDYDDDPGTTVATVRDYARWFKPPNAEEDIKKIFTARDGFVDVGVYKEGRFVYTPRGCVEIDEENMDYLEYVLGLRDMDGNDNKFIILSKEDVWTEKTYDSIIEYAKDAGMVVLGMDVLKWSGWKKLIGEHIELLTGSTKFVYDGENIAISEDFAVPMSFFMTLEDGKSPGIEEVFPGCSRAKRVTVFGNGVVQVEFNNKSFTTHVDFYKDKVVYSVVPFSNGTYTVTVGRGSNIDLSSMIPVGDELSGVVNWETLVDVKRVDYDGGKSTLYGKDARVTVEMIKAVVEVETNGVKVTKSLEEFKRVARTVPYVDKVAQILLVS